MKRDIIHTLKEIEKIENIEILFACESGLRVWGFAGDSTKYNVGFIYKKANLSDYLSLKEKSDVIEYSTDDIDLVGWDIRKALVLHHENNPLLREWLISNQIYIDKGITDIFHDLGDFDRNVLKNYYHTMATSHWKRYCGLKYQEKKVKKYLYVIRSILCWNILNSQDDPPLSIQELLNHPHSGISNENRIEVLNLISNLDTCKRIEEDTIFKLNNFILNSMKMMKKVKTDSVKDFEAYESTFRQLLLIVR